MTAWQNWQTDIEWAKFRAKMPDWERVTMADIKFLPNKNLYDDRQTNQHFPASNECLIIFGLKNVFFVTEFNLINLAAVEKKGFNVILALIYVLIVHLSLFLTLMQQILTKVMIIIY